MDSPVRKQLKRNDYLRHKMFRKINRRKKAERKLAIEAPMKELRKRLRRYDGGKRPNDDEPVTNYQIPFIKDKLIKLSNAGLATGAVLSTNLLDTIADNAFRANLPLKTAMGLAVKESTLGNPTDDRSMRTLLNKKRQKELAELLQEMYGLLYDQLFGLHINYGNAVSGKELINYWRGIVENKPEPPFTTSNPDRKSVVQKSFEFYNESPHKYNPGQKNYLKLVNRRGEELYNSPEYQKWLDEYSLKKAKLYIMKPKSYLLNIKVGFKGGKSSDDNIVYETQNTEDGTIYRVHPSAFGAKELNVTAPEVVVKTRDPRKYSSAFNGNQEYLDDLVGFVPVAGDINDAINAGIAVKNNNYSLAALLGAGLLLPNVIQKPLNGIFKYGMRHINRSFADRLRNQFDALVDLELAIKNKSYNNNGTEFMQNYVKDNSLVIDGFPKANYSKYKSPDGSKLNVYINSGGYGSILTNGNHPHTVIETAALKDLPGTGLTYNSHMLYGLTPTEKMQYFRALNSMPNGAYIGEGFNPTLGLLAIDTYRKTGSRFGAYKQIWKGGKQIRMNSHLDAPYSADSYKLVLKLANRPGYELRYTDVPSWGFNNVGEFDPLTRFGDVDLDAKHLDKVNEYILNANPNARTAYIKDGKLMLPVPILKKSYKNGKSSGIYIKPLNRGKFTALKKRTGKSASWFKAHGTPALKKMATFALNAKKWKH